MKNDANIVHQFLIKFSIKKLKKNKNLESLGDAEVPALSHSRRY